MHCIESIELYNIYNKLKILDNNYSEIIIEISNIGISVYIKHRY